jgi:hypothetical protein
MRTEGRPGDSEQDDARTVPPPAAVPGAEADRVFALEVEVAQLKEAVTSHAVVDQAIGSVVALGRVTPDQGWAVLREVSQHTNVKLRHVAELILLWARTGDLPEEIRAALEEALRRRAPVRPPGRVRPPARVSTPPGPVTPVTELAFERLPGRFGSEPVPAARPSGRATVVRGARRGGAGVAVLTGPPRRRRPAPRAGGRSSR